MSDPDHTAVRLVTAAERLIAEGGEEATSLRAITREARSNAAAVHYHFGGRDELLRAVLDQHLSPLARRQLALLGLAASAGEPVPVVALVDAVIRPAMELLAELRVDQVQLARLLGRAHTLPGVAVAELVERRFQALAQPMVPMLRRSLPAIDEPELRLRLRLVVAAAEFVFATAPGPEAPDGPLGTNDLDEQVRRLVTFCAAAMSASTDLGGTTPSRARARTASPGTESPATASPGTESPATESQGIGSPATESRGIGSPATESRGIESQGIASDLPTTRQAPMKKVTASKRATSKSVTAKPAPTSPAGAKTAASKTAKPAGTRGKKAAAKQPPLPDKGGSKKRKKH